MVFIEQFHNLEIPYLTYQHWSIDVCTAAICQEAQFCKNVDNMDLCSFIFLFCKLPFQQDYRQVSPRSILFILMVTFIVLWKFTMTFQHGWTFRWKGLFHYTKYPKLHIRKVVLVACIHHRNWKRDLTIIRRSFNNIFPSSYQLSAKRDY